MVITDAIQRGLNHRAHHRPVILTAVNRADTKHVTGEVGMPGTAPCAHTNVALDMNRPRHETLLDLTEQHHRAQEFLCLKLTVLLITEFIRRIPRRKPKSSRCQRNLWPAGGGAFRADDGAPGAAAGAGPGTGQSEDLAEKTPAQA
ncbi:hypothetical protein AB0L67_39920 [Streptomyces flaveolus]|uniref:hypothetical protein n=1 Tax=Streptomyces flaveolus TaxID=67297 RepID=UPI00342F88D2